MAETVRSLPPEVQELVDIREWQLRSREGIKRFRELQVKHLPSLALDGQLVYQAFIPPVEELGQLIRDRWQEKVRGLE